MATFTDIVRKQREKGEGLGSSLSTAFSERAKERLDPRNYLFKRKGLLTALLPGLKGYQSKTGAEKLKSGGSEGLGAGAESILNTVADRLGEMKRQFKMVAKNSIVLPQMAMDTNITRRNIQELVRMQKGTPYQKADMFFKRSADRESQYESSMKAGKPTSIKEEKKDVKEKSLLEKIFGFLTGPIGILVSIFSSVLGTLTGGLKRLSEVIGSILSMASTAGLIKTGANLVNGALNVGKTVGNTAGKAGTNIAKGAMSVGRGLAAATAGTGALIANTAGKLLGKTPKPKFDSGNYRNNYDLAFRKEVENKSLWGRFCSFVARKAPNLWARIGTRLATAGVLVGAPIVGWVMAAVEIGFAIWTAIELYNLWREFTNLPEESDTPNLNDIPKLETSKETSPTTAPMSGREKGKNLEKTAANAASKVRGEDRENQPMPESLKGGKLKSLDEIGTAIGRGESRGNYDAVNLGKKNGYKPGILDGTDGKPKLTDMTIRELLSRMGKKEFISAGKYQYQKERIEFFMKGKNPLLKETDKFDGATQEKLFKTDVSQILKNAGDNPARQQEALSKVWGAVADPTSGQTALGGVNKASIYSKDLFNGIPETSTQVAATEQAAIPATEDMSSYNKEYNKERLDAIYNYDKAKIPSKLTTDDKTSSGDTYNVDNSKKVASGSSTPPGVAASAWNDDIIRLLLMAATDSNFSATR
jgi:hypothetical protein